MSGPEDEPNVETNCSFEIDEEDGPPWDCDAGFPLEGEGEEE
jgi:hypothetical protein